MPSPRRGLGSRSGATPRAAALPGSGGFASIPLRLRAPAGAAADPGGGRRGAGRGKPSRAPEIGGDLDKRPQNLLNPGVALRILAIFKFLINPYNYGITLILSVTFKTSSWLSVLGVLWTDSRNTHWAFSCPAPGHCTPTLCHSERGRAAGAHGNCLGMEMLHVVCSNSNTAVCTATESLRLRTETTAFHWLVTDPLLSGFSCCCLFLVLWVFLVDFFSHGCFQNSFKPP